MWLVRLVGISNLTEIQLAENLVLYLFGIGLILQCRAKSKLLRLVIWGPPQVDVHLIFHLYSWRVSSAYPNWFPCCPVNTLHALPLLSLFLEWAPLSMLSTSYTISGPSSDITSLWNFSDTLWSPSPFSSAPFLTTYCVTGMKFNIVGTNWSKWLLVIALAQGSKGFPFVPDSSL